MIMMLVTIMMMVMMTVRAEPALDSYQGKQQRLALYTLEKNILPLDSMAKYKAWHSKYGLGAVKVVTEETDSNRIERNVNNGKIFRPHR